MIISILLLLFFSFRESCCLDNLIETQPIKKHITSTKQETGKGKSYSLHHLQLTTHDGNSTRRYCKASHRWLIKQHQMLGRRCSLNCFAHFFLVVMTTRPWMFHPLPSMSVLYIVIEVINRVYLSQQKC